MNAPTRILLIKPYQECVNYAIAPVLGLLYLTSTLRERLGDRVHVRVHDAKLDRDDPADLDDLMRSADIVGLSAMNFEEAVSLEIARRAKALDANKLVVLGGPLAHGRMAELLNRCPELDWAVDGEADLTFPEAVERWISGEALDSVPGLSFRTAEGLHIGRPPEAIADLDSLPMPAWDLVDFDRYSEDPGLTHFMKGTRYAMIFTSRGCPYLCSYCHDIFGKKFRSRSTANVLAEIDHLVTTYGVDEFQITDDIFNLNRKRVKEIFGGVVERYGRGKLHFCFPNGLRGDILRDDVVEALADGGTYHICVAIETVTPRLQTLIDKHLDVEKTARFIRTCNDHGIVTKGFFMLGFPTETPREMWNTIWFAWTSRLAMASFFSVVPHPATPMYDLAEAESSDALERLDTASMYGSKPWYELAYGFPLGWVLRLTLVVFYLAPWRAVRVVRFFGFAHAVTGFRALLSILLRRSSVTRPVASSEPEPAAAA